MREIKFRYWETDFKRMTIADSNNTFGLFEQNSYPVMQYTGLKDKNGREIYEGDILRGKDYPFVSDGKENYVAVVERSENHGGFYSYPQACSDRVRGMAAGDYVFDDGQKSAKRFEIIGNIYENPELIQ